MCGIIGSTDIQVTTDALRSLGHRGPDGSGLEVFQHFGRQTWLGHTRLAIQDLTDAGRQPLESSDGRWWVTFNGEIYNHLELRKGLSNSWRGHCDSETLVELLASEGIERSLRKLNGIFAFAALDLRDGKLYLVRDPFGVKPLYYFHRSKGFAFASEIRALRALDPELLSVDPSGVQLFLALRYVPSPSTLWTSVSRVAPGHFVSLDLAAGSVSSSCYIEPVGERFTGSIGDAAAAYREKLKNAVRRQLLSDVPVGILLSGGIDSALIAAMARECGQRLPCFTVGYEGAHVECEISDAEATAKELDLPFVPIRIDAHDMRSKLDEIVRSIEEPLGTTSVMPMRYLVDGARQHVTVVLTGQGSDEPWGGYTRYQVEFIRRMLPFPRAWSMINTAFFRGNCWPEWLERGLRTLAVRDPVSRIVEACLLFSSEDRFQLTGDRGDGGAVARASSWFDWIRLTVNDPAEQMMHLDARMNLADDLLLYGDKISMAVNLEARVPMLDLDLMNFVESLPLDFRVRLGRTKIVHKRMAAEYLPDTIIHRRKKAFEVPFGKWSRNIWRDFCEDSLFETNAPHWSWLNRPAVKRIWDQHLGQKPDRSRQLFALLMFALWCRQQ